MHRLQSTCTFRLVAQPREGAPGLHCYLLLPVTTHHALTVELACTETNRLVDSYPDISSDSPLAEQKVPQAHCITLCS